MVCYIVVFEVSDSTKREALRQSLKSFGGYCPLTPGSWAITTERKAEEVRDQLKGTIGPGDRLYVFRSGTEGAWLNSYGEENTEWLKKNL